MSPILVTNEVGRLDIAMDEALGVSGLEASSDVDGNIDQLLEIEWLAAEEMLGKDRGGRRLVLRIRRT